MGPTPGSFTAGDPRINRNGRPRSGLAFAERVRERIDPDMMIDLAMRVAEDTGMTPAERLAALWPLIDRGFIKPPAQLEAHVTGNATPSYDLSKLPLDERRALLEKLRALRTTSPDEDPRLPEPAVSDDVSE